MARKYYQEFWRDVDGSTEIKVTVEFTQAPVISATYDDPEEGGEVEILKAHTDADGWDAKWSDEEEARWIQYLEENPVPDNGPDADDLRDAARDRDL